MFKFLSGSKKPNTTERATPEVTPPPPPYIFSEEDNKLVDVFGNLKYKKDPEYNDDSIGVIIHKDSINFTHIIIQPWWMSMSRITRIFINGADMTEYFNESVLRAAVDARLAAEKVSADALIKKEIYAQSMAVLRELP